MDILSIIKNRRSVRRYLKNTPSDYEIKRVLDAARWAPSGLNNQPWRFLIIKDKETRYHLAGFTKYGYILKSSPVAIVICMSIPDSYNRDKDLMSIGACIQNLCLEAYSIGLGTCWLGEILNNKQKVSKYLELNKNLEAVAVIALGYPRGNAVKPCRKPISALRIKII